MFEWFLLYDVVRLTAPASVIMCAKVSFIFVGLVAARVAVPRLKLEAISRIG